MLGCSAARGSSSANGRHLHTPARSASRGALLHAWGQDTPWGRQQLVAAAFGPGCHSLLLLTAARSLFWVKLDLAGGGGGGGSDVITTVSLKVGHSLCMCSCLLLQAAACCCKQLPAAASRACTPVHV